WKTAPLMASAAPRTSANSMRGTLIPKTMLISCPPSSSSKEAEPANTLAVVVMRMTASRTVICLFIHAFGRLPEPFRDSRTRTGQEIRIDIALIFRITDGHILQPRRVADGLAQCLIREPHYGDKYVRIPFHYVFITHSRIALHNIKRLPHINPSEGIINERSERVCIYLRRIQNMDECR